jgi:hypothetical protein
MNYKIVFQLLLLTFIIFLVIYFYKDYLYQQDIKLNLSSKPMNNLNIKDIQNNVVKDISYKKMYNLTGDEFVIKGAYGEFIEENNDIIMITDVKAFVNKNDGTSVYIKSDKAIYDTVNYETNFTNNVELIYLDHKINVDFLDLFFSNNLIQAYGNLIYQNLEYKLLADKLELDIITKNIKIFMLDNSNVKIKRY